MAWERSDSGKWGKIKFSSIIKADEQVMLKLTKKESSVEFTYMADDKVCSSGIFVL